MMSHELPIGLAPLFEMEVTVGAVQVVGGPAGIDRRVAPMGAGKFEGERLAGLVLAGGSDWQLSRKDGAILIDARVLLKTHDDVVIAMEYQGIRHGPAEVTERLGRGEEVDPRDYYFRIAPRFTAPAGRYQWLNSILAVGTGHRLPAGPRYSLYEVI